jgi:hypothetical protein
MSDFNQKIISEEENLEIKLLRAKINSIEKRERRSITELKLRFREIYQKFKEEMNRKVELKDHIIIKLKLKISELESEMKKILFITDVKYLNEKTELENVILKQEELIENLYKKNDNLLKSVNSKNNQLNSLKIKLKDEEFINRKNRIFENSPIRNNNNISIISKNIIPSNEINNNSIIDRSMINKIGEVEYFKGLNKNLQDQIRGDFLLI